MFACADTGRGSAARGRSVPARGGRPRARGVRLVPWRGRVRAGLSGGIRRLGAAAGGSVCLLVGGLNTAQQLTRCVSGGRSGGQNSRYQQRYYLGIGRSTNRSGSLRRNVFTNGPNDEPVQGATSPTADQNMYRSRLPGLVLRSVCLGQHSCGHYPKLTLARRGGVMHPP